MNGTTTSSNGSEGQHHRHATIDSIIIGQGRNRAWSIEGARGAVNEFTPLIGPSFSFPKNNQQQHRLPPQQPLSSSEITEPTVNTTTIAAPAIKNEKLKKNQTKKGDSEFSVFICLHYVESETLLYMFLNSSSLILNTYSYIYTPVQY
jgi:hypothetical protein